MKVNFINHSVYEACLCLNGGAEHIVGGKKCLALNVEEDFFRVTVKKNVQNAKKKQKDCIIKTEYHVFGAAENSLFHIDREKMAVSATVAYDAMLLSCESAECTAKKYEAANAEELKKDFQKGRLFEIFIFDPIMDFFLDGGIILAILLLLLGFFVSWGLAGAILAGLYIFDVVINFIGDKTADIFCKKVANVKPDKEELYALLDSENIKTFYMNPARKPWCGEIEQD